MSTITANLSPAFNIVSITSATKTVVVSGNATATILANSVVGLLGMGSAVNGSYTVTAAAPVFAAGNTTFVLTTDPGTNGASGTARRRYTASNTNAWVGGVVPVAGDTGVIPATSDVEVVGAASPAGALLLVSGRLSINISSTHSTVIIIQSGGVVDINLASGVAQMNMPIIVRSGGAFTCTGAATINTFKSLFRVEGGGTVAFKGTPVSGFMVLEPGAVASVTSTSVASNGHFYVQHGATLNLTGTSLAFAGTLTVESGGTAIATASATVTGTVTAFTNATLTNIVANVLPGLEKRTVHYTGNINNVIVVFNDTKTLYTSGGTAMADCLAGNILTGKSIGGVSGSYVVVSAANVLAGVAFGASSAQTGTLDITTDNGVAVTLTLKLAGLLRWWWRRLPITLAADGADEIYYTTDGSTPSAGNPSASLYTGPIKVSTDCLRAVAVIDDVAGLVTDIQVGG